uniref:ATP-dependent NAD(P)H-hydrate dehydratase n=1 Tax=Romanomermis culicivorax TaxID=13658 RepID=A0A915HS00_ROMCU
FNPDSLLETLDSLIPRLHAAVVGPGFGRSDAGFNAFKAVVNRLKSANLPFIIDADGLYFVTKDVGLVRNYRSVILTPNAVEFDRLFVAARCENEQNDEKIEILCKSLGNVVIVQKGHFDLISNGDKILRCEEPSSFRRCGGQGDLLSGSLGTFTHWALDAMKNKDNKSCILDEYGPFMIAAYGACSLTKQCNRMAFDKIGRSCTTEDMIQCIHSAVKNIFN